MKVEHTDYNTKRIYLDGVLGFKLTKYTGNHEVFEVPDNIIGIGGGAFANNTTLKRIRFPQSVTMLGESVCANCSCLESIELSDNIMEIKKNSFENCVNLTDIKLSNHLQVINHGAFLNCKNLKSIVIPKSVKLIYGVETYCQLKYYSNVKSTGQAACSTSSCDFASKKTYTKSAASKQIYNYSSFENCEQLTCLYFLGNLPHIEGDLLLNTSATIYCKKETIDQFRSKFSQYNCQVMYDN